MEAKLNIAKRIKVGYRNRSDTYNGKLAYVIYYDEKGKLRKETSWESWRDKEIDPDEFDNAPTSGFVLNKGVGGVRQSCGWNPRNEYLRVYDPRGFEFEISVANLVFILQECSAIKGKGLEGEFVYAWDGADLILLPVDSKEYKTSVEFTGLKSERVSAKSMVPGNVYLTKQMKEVIYVGSFYLWGERYDHCYGEKRHVFVELTDVNKNNQNKFKKESGFAFLAKQVSTSPDADTYAKLYAEFVQGKDVAKPVSIATNPCDSEALMKLLGRAAKLANEQFSIRSCTVSGGVIIQKDNKLYSVRILDAVEYSRSGRRYYYTKESLPESYAQSVKEGKPYLIYLCEIISMASNGVERTTCKIKVKAEKENESKSEARRNRNNINLQYPYLFMSAEELKSSLVNVIVTLENGKEIDLNKKLESNTYY